MVLCVKPATTNHVFRALADPSRRSIVDRLSQGPASVSELAEPYNMSLPAVSMGFGAMNDDTWIALASA